VKASGKIYREEGARLCAVVDRFEDVPVLVLADLVLDEFLHAEIERVSREAPVLIVQHRSLQAMPGGGANAVNNVRALGGKPVPVGVVGLDDAGSRLTDLLHRGGIDVSGIAVAEGYETPTKTRVLAALPHSRPQQVVRIDRGSPHSVEAASARAAVERAEALLDDARLREAGERLLKGLGAEDVLITRGSRGMLLFDAAEGPMEIPVFGSDQVADVTGAGDTVIAAFTLALASGATPFDAALVANAAAGLVVMKRGTAVVTARELTDALRRAGTARG